jgi:hypothetical protein
MTKFELSPKEINAYESFIKKLPKKYRSMEKQMIFSFGNGIGVGVTIKVGDREKDITDYNTW